MEHSQPVSQDTPSNVRDIILSADRFGTWVAETIRASGRMCRVNRPDTRLLLTSAKINFKYVLLCSSYPHRPFRQSAAFPKSEWRQRRTERSLRRIAILYSGQSPGLAPSFGSFSRRVSVLNRDARPLATPQIRSVRASTPTALASLCIQSENSRIIGSFFRDDG